MSVFTNEVDVFTLKTTNINICISPILKVKIMENGIKMGVNLSDYVNYVLTKSMMGQMETDVESTPQYKKLKEAYETLEAVNEQDQERLATMSKRIASLQNQLLATQMELSKYETQVAPFKENVEIGRAHV